MQQQFFVPDPLEEAARKAHAALERVGTVTKAVSGQPLGGRIVYGLRKVDVRILCFPAHGGTNIQIEALGQDLIDVAAGSALRRYRETYLNLNNRSFRPDRRGIHPVVLTLLILACLGLLALLFALKFGMIGF